jgi:hypothetical protein
MEQDTQHASRDSSHAYMLDVVQFHDNSRSKRLFRIILGRCLLTIISRIIFRNKGFFKLLPKRLI